MKRPDHEDRRDSARASARGGSMRLPRIVALGGGTGLPVVLRGLKGELFPPGGAPRRGEERERGGEPITAIVTVADDGGSSGRLRRAYGLPAPGDIRNCLLALAEGDAALREIFAHRFDGDAEAGLGGHSLGNLILAALARTERGFPEAVRRAGSILKIRGSVLPSTPASVTLLGQIAGGEWIEGESRLAAARGVLRRVTLRPAGAPATPGACAAIAAADLIVIGPGSLYTSLIPVLLVREIAAAVAASGAPVALVMNLMTEPGETDAYTAADVLRAIRRHAPRVRVSDVLLNAAPVPADLLARYAAGRARPIRPDGVALRALGCRTVEADLIGEGPLLRHHPGKVARALLERVPVPSAGDTIHRNTASSQAQGEWLTARSI
jgi:uncharacterized cofD-like protein